MNAIHNSILNVVVASQRTSRLVRLLAGLTMTSETVESVMRKATTRGVSHPRPEDI